MTRAMDDKTSTCESCIYWARSSGDDEPKDMGYCGWISLPAWTRKYIPIKPSYAMLGSDGLDCWQHTKRDVESGVQFPQNDFSTK